MGKFSLCTGEMSVLEEESETEIWQAVLLTVRLLIGSTDL